MSVAVTDKEKTVYQKGYGIATLMNTDRGNLRTDIPEMILDMIEE